MRGGFKLLKRLINTILGNTAVVPRIAGSQHFNNVWISAHQNGDVTRSNQGNGVYNFVPASSSVYDPGARPYVYVPGMAEGQ
jgi:hypothetical protein